MFMENGCIHWSFLCPCTNIGKNVKYELNTCIQRLISLISLSLFFKQGSLPDFTYVFDALKESWKNSGYYLYTLESDIWKYASPVSDRIYQSK